MNDLASTSVPQADTWQAGFLSLLPAVRTHAQIQFRKLPPLRREEAIQEAIASACVSYQILAAKGRLHEAHPGTIADYAVCHVRNCRHVGGHQDGARDVMSPVAQRRHGIQVKCLHLRPSGGGCYGWKQMVTADRNASIPDLAAFRIDFGRWLRMLAKRDRKIISALVSGERALAVAGRFGISAGRVSQLRRRYERDWRIFQGENTTGEAA